MTVRIIGAGMAGLLAGSMFRGQAQIYESAPSLPNNHHALLRFRSDGISNHLNIPFQAVDVVKIVGRRMGVNGSFIHFFILHFSIKLASL